MQNSTQPQVQVIDAIEAAWSSGEQIAGAVRPEQLTAATACDGWDVRALLNHTLGESAMFTTVNLGGPSELDGRDHVGDGDRLGATWAAIASANVESWRVAGLGGDRTYFFGTFPAGACAVINLGEIIVHTWDLATATGQAVELDTDHVRLVHELYANLPMDELRANGVYGPLVTVPDTAPLADRLLGLLGRRP